ncbi:Mitochondrial distribution and morphology protein 12 [Microbotryomycetes sp. JL201]|nr:Mitochondrial distribution and morphology protein 12 [Microbotryomycetes sp. JL201]
MAAHSPAGSDRQRFESFPTYVNDNEDETIGSKLIRFFLPTLTPTPVLLPPSKQHSREASAQGSAAGATTQAPSAPSPSLQRISSSSTTVSLAGSADEQGSDSDADQFRLRTSSSVATTSNHVNGPPSAAAASSSAAPVTLSNATPAALALTSAVAKHDAAQSEQTKLHSKSRPGAAVQRPPRPVRLSTLHTSGTKDISDLKSSASVYGESRCAPSEAFGPVGGLYGSPSAGDSFTLANLSSIPGFPLQQDGADDGRSVRSMSTTARTSPSVIHVFRKLRGEGLSTDYWIKDESSRECFDCQAVFTAFRRKHHCRICGQIFCSRCASNIISSARFGQVGHIRVCNLCLSVLEHETKPPESTAGRTYVASPLRISAPLETLMRAPLRTNAPSRLSGPAFDHDMSSIWEADSQARTPISEGTDSDVDDGDLGQLARPKKSPRPPSTAVAPFRRSLGEEDSKQHEGTNFELVPSDEREDETTLTISLRAPSHAKHVDGLTSTTAAAIRRLPSGGSGQDTQQDRALSRLSSYVQDANLGTPLQWRNAETPDMGQEALFADLDRDWRLGEIKAPLENSARQDRLPLTNEAINHMKKMMRQSLEHRHVPNPKLWTRILTPLLLHVADDLVPDLGVGGNIDVREYIRIKKMPGGRPRDSEYIEGVVFTKNLMHKQMKRCLINPRIMLLAFPLEYHRVENQLTSLETLVKQEREYLHNLVQRVVAQRPHIILVERNVSRLALEFLLENGMAVARNVKREALHSVARATQADVITSIDKLALEPRLGRCGVFRVQTFVHQAIPGGRKTLLRFDGCPKDLCCTLLLRGGTLAELKKVKKIVDMMTLIAYNAKLESYLFRDETLTMPSNDENQKRQSYIRPLLADLDLSEQERISEDVSDALRPYQQTALSGSSFVHFSPPYPLARMNEEHQHVVALRRLREHEETQKVLTEESESLRGMSTSTSAVSLSSLVPASQTTGVTGLGLMTETAPSSSVITEPTLGSSIELEPAVKPTEDPLSVLQTPEELEESTRFAEAERQHAEQLTIWDAYMANRHDSLDPLDHQCIYFLASKVYGQGENTRMCELPTVKNIKFYGENDMALGRWISESCETAAWACRSESGCGASAYEHHKILVHGQYRLVIRMMRQQDRHLSKLGSDDGAIWMRSQCKICGSLSHESLMSTETYRFSFGKYLELSFYADHQSLMRIDGPCVHNGHIDHRRYFRIGKSILEVSMDRIDLRSVVPPPRRLRIKPEKQLQLRNEEYLAVLGKSNAFWDSIVRRISTFNYEIVQADRVEECRQALVDLSTKCESDRRAIIKLLKSTYERAQSTNGTEMTAVRRTLQNKAVDWEAEWAAFEQRLAPMEKDVRRLTATQLKRLFSADGMPLSPERDRRIASPGLETSIEAEEKDSRLSSPQKAIGDTHDSDGPATGPLVASNPLEPLDLPPAILGEPEQVSRAETSGAESDSTVCADQTPVNTHTHLPSTFRQRQHQADDTSGAESEWAPPPLPSRKQSRQNPGVAQLVEYFQEGGTLSAGHGTAKPSPGKATASGRPLLRRGITDGKPRPRTRPAPKEVLSDGDGSYARNVGVSHLSRKKSFADKPSRIPAPKLFTKAESLQAMFERGRIKAEQPRSRPTSRPPTRPGSPRSSSPKATFTHKLSSSPSESRASSRPPSRTGRQAPTFSRTSSLENTGLQIKPTRPSLSAASTSWSSRASSKVRARDGASTREAESSEGPPSKSAPRDQSLSRPTIGGTLTKAARRVVSATSSHRVSTIANHFNRLSKANERERQKRFAMIRSKRARPVVSEQPTIQVFDNLKDATKEDSDDDTRSSDGADDEDDDEHDVDSDAEAVSKIEPSASGHKNCDEAMVHSDLPDTTSAASRPPISMADALLWPPIEAILPVTDSTHTENSHGNVEDANALKSSKTEPSSSDALSVPPSPLLPEHFATLPRMSEGESSGNERGSIMKAISSLWAFRGHELAPLEYPLAPSEHIFADNPILVRDDEPTSILAFALSSRAYRSKLEEQSASVQTRIVERSEAFMPDETILADRSTWGLLDVAQLQEGTDNEEALRKPEGKHFRLQFEEGSTTFFCKIFFAEQFDALRRNCGCSTQYIESLARCIQWESSGGKSKVNFLKTKDDRFIVKEISRLEMDALLRFAPAYFEYMSKAIFHGLPTILAKIFGFYRIGLRNPTTGKVMRLDVLVMENLFYERHLSQVFDLKGSTRNRKVTVSPDKPNEVLMDENLLQMANTHPLYVREESKRLLKAAIFNDTLFLSNLSKQSRTSASVMTNSSAADVMDYSLVVGVDSVKQELVVGIVGKSPRWSGPTNWSDFIPIQTSFARTHGTNVSKIGSKTAHSSVASSDASPRRIYPSLIFNLNTGGSSKAGGPTIITPKQYKQRFREAMEGYFLLSPDAWISESSLQPITCCSSQETFATADLTTEVVVEPKPGRAT